MNTESKVAIVTGGGRGMGAAIARELHGRGYALALMSPSDSAERLAAELGGLGTRGSAESGEDIEALVRQTLERYGRIDAVVNHTGHPPKGELLEISDEDWHRGSSTSPPFRPSSPCSFIRSPRPCGPASAASPSSTPTATRRRASA
jgi:NAD(P)-dependent dehydrogenase (short-subunit alcohol dehydrogenase family)